jgi:hypothetical protein
MSSDLALEAIKISLTVAAGLWVYFRFVRERSHARRVLFTIQCQFFGPIDGKYAVELTLNVKNGGLVVHRFKRLRIRLRGIDEVDELSGWEGQPSRLAFPRNLVDEPDAIFAKNYGSLFVEPGVDQPITFVSMIPASTRLVLARAEFEYEEGRTHSVEKVFEPNARAKSAAPLQ